MIKFAKIIFPVSVCLWLFSSIFISYQVNRLTIDYQQTLNAIETVKLYNEDLELEIAKLQNKERIFKLALENAMEQDLDRVFVIK